MQYHGTLQRRQTGFLWLRAVFRSFLHDFSPFSAVFAWFFTVFKMQKSDSYFFRPLLNRFLIFQHPTVDVKMRSNTLEVRIKPLKWRPKIENCESPKRVLAKVSCLPSVPFWKLGSRMDAPIFVFLGIRDFSFFCGHFNLYTVNGKSL